MSESFSQHAVHELLPWYVTGTLDAEETVTFREHLAACPTCREELRTVETLREQAERHGAAYFADHPSSERLVAAVTGGLAAADEGEVRRHLALCATCAREARWVDGSEQAGAAKILRFARRPVIPWGWVAGAAAAGAALALFLPFRSGIEPATRIVRPEFVAPTEMAPQSQNVFEPAPGQGSVLLVFEVDLDPDRFPITVSIANEQEKIVFRRGPIEREWLQRGTYLYLDCNLHDCAPGSYTARIAPVAGGEPLTIGFTIRSQD